MSECIYCEGTKRIRVLNVWRIQRRYRVNGGDVAAAVGQSVSDLPFIELENACPACCGEAAHTEAMIELGRQMGGDPFAPETFDNEGQA